MDEGGGEEGSGERWRMAFSDGISSFNAPASNVSPVKLGSGVLERRKFSLVFLL